MGRNIKGDADHSCRAPLTRGIYADKLMRAVDVNIYVLSRVGPTYPKRRKRRTRHRAEIAPRSVKQDLTCQKEGRTLPVNIKVAEVRNHEAILHATHPVGA